MYTGHFHILLGLFLQAQFPGMEIQSQNLGLLNIIHVVFSHYYWQQKKFLFSFLFLVTNEIIHLFIISHLHFFCELHVHMLQLDYLSDLY